MKEKIIFKTYYGSKLYGTDSKSSDTDFKGIFLPDKTDLILGKAPKHYQSSTGFNTKKNSANDVDETYYSLHYFLDLLVKGDTTAVDMLFAYTNPFAIVVMDPIMQELINNKEHLLTRNIKSYLGFAKGQSIKYSLKGDKLNNYLTFKNYLQRQNSNEIFGDNFAFNNLIESFIPYEKKGVIIGKRALFLSKEFGEHSYIVEMNNKERFFMISDVLFSMSATVGTLILQVNKVIASYGKRAEIAAENKGADWKALSHAVRALIQTEELLKTGIIQFPLKEAKFIKDIKYNTGLYSFDDVLNIIETKLNYIENDLLPLSDLRETADNKWIENFILKVYKESR